MNNQPTVYGWNVDLVATSEHFGQRVIPIMAAIRPHPITGDPVCSLTAIVPTGIPDQPDMQPYHTSIELAVPMPYATPAELENAWPRPMMVIGNMVGALCGLGVVTFDGLLPLASQLTSLPLQEIPEPDWITWPHGDRDSSWYTVLYDVASTSIRVLQHTDDSAT